jgi:hypothetical protein
MRQTVVRICWFVGIWSGSVLLLGALSLTLRAWLR